MAKTKNDEAYERGVKDGKEGCSFDDLAQGFSKGINFSKEDEIYDKGYEFGAEHRHDSGSGGSSGGDCYIATEVYGNYNVPEVEVLRRFRDDTLSNYYLGKRFINFYYSGAGQRAAKIIGNIKFSKKLIKSTLDHLVSQIEKNKKSMEV